MVENQLKVRDKKGYVSRVTNCKAATGKTKRKYEEKRRRRRKGKEKQSVFVVSFSIADGECVLATMSSSVDELSKGN